jgi:hypothetical protein
MAMRNQKKTAVGDGLRHDALPRCHNVRVADERMHEWILDPQFSVFIALTEENGSTEPGAGP